MTPFSCPGVASPKIAPGTRHVPPAVSPTHMMLNKWPESKLFTTPLPRDGFIQKFFPVRKRLDKSHCRRRHHFYNCPTNFPWNQSLGRLRADHCDSRDRANRNFLRRNCRGARQGQMGIAALAVAKSAGVSEVILRGGPNYQLETAKHFGADHVKRTPAERIAAVCELSRGQAEFSRSRKKAVRFGS